MAATSSKASPTYAKTVPPAANALLIHPALKLSSSTSGTAISNLPRITGILRRFVSFTTAVKKQSSVFLPTQKKNTQWDLHISVAWLVSLTGSGLSLLPWILKSMYCIGGYTVFFAFPVFFSAFGLLAAYYSKSHLSFSTKDGFFDRLCLGCWKTAQAFLYIENPRQCRGFKKALAMSRSNSSNWYNENAVWQLQTKTNRRNVKWMTIIV